MHEVPPTAGLPLGVADLLARSEVSFEKSLESFLGVTAVQPDRGAKRFKTQQ
jgi:hypothetical protein